MADVARAIREIGVHLGSKIESTNDHLKVVQVEVVGVGAAIVALKSSTEKNFDQTQRLQERQTSAMVQLDSVKTYTEAVSLSAKAASFSQEVDQRFNKAVEGIVLNRILYDKHFGAIHEEHAEKLRTIGSHIYSIWAEDFSRLEETARVPTAAYAEVSFEVDLQRLASRSEQLDQDLDLIRTQHLEPLVALDSHFESTMRETFAFDDVSADSRLYIPAMVTLRADGAALEVDRRAVVSGDEAGGEIASLQPMGRAPTLDAACNSPEVLARVARACHVRPMTDEESGELTAAIGRLAERGLISPQLATGFVQFVQGVRMGIVDAAYEEGTVANAGSR